LLWSCCCHIIQISRNELLNHVPVSFAAVAVCLAQIFAFLSFHGK
jgi:hypothetical protein